MTVRTGGAEDRDGIHRLINDAFVVERFIKKDGGDRLDPGGEEMDRLSARGTFLVLEEHGSLRGCVYVEPRGERCYLGLLSVAPDQQGKGLGRQLMLAAEKFARDQGCRAMDLRVVSPRRDELVPFYLNSGYQEQGTQEYPPELGREMRVAGHFILMAKPL